MASILPLRQQQQLPTPPKRTSSLSSRTGSQRSSNSLSQQQQQQQQQHKKGPSQSSIGVASSRASAQSSPYKSQSQSIQQNAPPKKKGPRLKSQYPLSSSEPHVEYILVASFDIDRGPVMEHQYPGAISPDENMLAELMLPDQVHERPQDWTMFFLHKDGASVEDESAEQERKEKIKQRKLARQQQKMAGIEPEPGTSDGDSDSDSDDDDNDGLEGPPLMYVLNLVNTKLDATKKRGAHVQAMAICTRHSFLHIYKPLLLLALQDYFNNPSQDILEALYNSVNAMDLSLMPRLSVLEKSVLQSNDVKDLFVDKFDTMIDQRLDDDQAGRLHTLPESPSRANTVKYSVPRDTHEFESKIIYHDIPIPVKIPTAPSAETVGDFSLIQLVQTFNTPHVTQPQPFALHPHLTTAGAYTHPIIVLINAILTEKRVIFLGHKRPSGEVAEAVLAACAIASGGVLRGFTRHAFPYTDLSKIDELLNVPGFIAGVTNPNFSFHPEWWDLLVDIPTGRIKISSSIASAAVTEGSTYFSQNGPGGAMLANLPKDATQDPTGDTAFMEDIITSIESRQGENIIRAKFRSYIAKFTRIAAAFEETVYGASSLSVLPPTEVEKPETSKSRKSSLASNRPLKGHGYVWPTEEAKTRELAATAAKIEGWRNTRSYYAFISDLATTSNKSPSSPSSATSISISDMLASPDLSVNAYGRPPKTYLDIYHSLSRLRTLRLLPSESAQIYLALESYCDSYESILELLSHTPIQEAGLFHLSLGLWHEDSKVRDATTILLDRIRNHPAGKVFFARLGNFVHTGFQRNLNNVENGPLVLESAST